MTLMPAKLDPNQADYDVLSFLAVVMELEALQTQKDTLAQMTEAEQEVTQNWLGTADELAEAEKLLLADAQEKSKTLSEWKLDVALQNQSITPQDKAFALASLRQLELSLARQAEPEQGLER